MRLRAALACGAAGVAAVLLLLAAAQPLATDDAWWHLALGRAFAEHGPWLAEDPLLFAAVDPPSSSAWLFDLTLYGVHRATGFPGLRALHAALVAANLALAAWLVRRASGSAVAASVATVAFVVLGAYRFAQLRPHLVTIAFALLLYRLWVDTDRPLSARRIAVGAVLFALWANLHAAFPVGLLLLGGAACAAALPALRAGADGVARARARRFGVAWIVGLAATACNPQGLRSHTAWLAAGASTPSLGRVIDEWAPVNPFAWPQPTLPPTPAALLLVWVLLVGMVCLVPRAVAALRSPLRAGRFDPAAVGASAVSLALMLAAVRFLWLGFFPLLLLARAAAPALARPCVGWALTLASVLLLGAFVRWGDWPMITRLMPRGAAATAYYAEPYAAHKYYVEPVWFARDAGLEGHLYADYFQSGFAGFWLAPRVRTLTNGTLNVAAETLRADAALEARRGLAEGETFTELLDRQDLDLFLGIRPPQAPHPVRPESSTTGHLEDTPGWIPLFRNLNSALYLRDAPRNRENRARTAAYYAERGVPFDPERGFDPLRAAREAPEWAIVHGLVPAGFGPLEHTARNDPGARGDAARDRVAALYTALGAHTEAAEMDRALLGSRPGELRARQRLVWNLLHLRRYAEAQLAAQALAARPSSDRLSHALARAPGELEALPAPAARALLATVPIFRRSEVLWLRAGTTNAQARTE